MTLGDNTTIKYREAESDVNQENSHDKDDFDREDNEIEIGFMKKCFK
jgi:hypothetical protein